MPGVASLVQSTASELSQPKVQLPNPVMMAFKAVHRVHRMWRWVRMGKIYSNPDNFLKLAAGHGLNFAFGDSVLLRISAVSVLIATRIFECVEQHGKLEKAWGKVVDSFKNRHPWPIKIKWETRASNRWISPSSVTWWRYHAADICHRTQRVALSLWNLCKQIFILSMRIMDATETFSLSPSTRNEGINQLFVNGTKWVDRLSENKDLLLKGLQANEAVIEKILKGIHSPLTSQQLIDAAAFSLNKVQQVHQASETVCKGFGFFIMACVKNWGYEFLWDLGLHHLVPSYLVPPPNPPWEIPPHEKLTERYPSLELVTRPSMLRKAKSSQSVKPASVKKSGAKKGSSPTLVDQKLILNRGSTRKGTLVYCDLLRRP